MRWFEVDKSGLAKLLDRKGGKQFAVFELVQNAWDEDTTRVDIEFVPVENCPQVLIRVTDDNPEGFKDIAHAFTLFAESTKKSDPTKRGRFNLGEKLVLACCITAEISTTKGTIIFDETGRSRSRKKTERGSVFTGYLKMKRMEYDEICQAVQTLIPPSHIETVFNGTRLKTRTPVTSIEAPLATEIADDEGVLRRTTRKTTINVYETLQGEVAHVYEMGIPVVETEDKYHVEIMQKVPLNLDRDNVPPSYLRALRTYTLNATYDALEETEATQAWVRDATADERCDVEAVTKVTTLRFGEKSVAYDPTDQEANKIAMSKGYTVIHGGSCSSGEWDNIRRAGVALPAGKVTPSGGVKFRAGGTPSLDDSQLTDGMKRVIKFARWMAKETCGITDLEVYVYPRLQGASACCGRSGSHSGHLAFGLMSCGHAFFDGFPNETYERVVDLLIHEFGHFNEEDHLSSRYYRELTRIGAKLVVLALTDKRKFSYRPMPKAETVA